MEPSHEQLMPLPGGWVIEPRREGVRARLADVWRYRRLLGFFCRKSLQKLYARTWLGAAWLFIRPLGPLAVNTLIFGKMLDVGSGGVPYFLFLTAGNTIWDLFSSSVTWGTRGLELNRGFMSRIYIPRLILPVASMTPSFLHFGMNLGVFVIALVYFRVKSGIWYLTPWNLEWAVFSAILAVVFALAVCLWTSVPAMQARDVRFTLGYVLGVWVFLTPVLYPIKVAPEHEWLLSLNPLVAVVTGFKYGLLGIGPINLRDFGASIAVTLVVLTSGFWFFGRAEADAGDRA